MSTTLNGHDIGSVNGASIINQGLSGAFLIVKATEGLGFNDPLHASFVQSARAANLLVGHYHYAWPENGGTAEATHFLNWATPQAGDVLVLDFEPYKSRAPQSSWAQYVVDFANTVHAKTGAWPWIYLNDDMAGRLTSSASSAQLAVIRSMPLWKAAYGAAPGSLWGWQALTAWQYSGTGIDKDIFYGDSSTWRALAVGGASLAPVSFGVDMPLTPQDAALVAAAVWQYAMNGGADGKQTVTTGNMVLNTYQGIYYGGPSTGNTSLASQIAKAANPAPAAPVTIDTAALAKAVAAAVVAALPKTTTGAVVASAGLSAADVQAVASAAATEVAKRMAS